jgi:anti-sigma B factor antagonist
VTDNPRAPVVVDVSPNVGVDVDARAQLIAKLKRLAADGYQIILLNVADLVYIDSVMLGALIQAYVGVIRSGGTLRLLNASDKLRKLLAISKLDRIIQ